MKLFGVNITREKRNAGISYGIKDASAFLEAFGLLPGAANATISTAQKLSAVHQAVRLISEDTAGLPINVYRKLPDGNIEAISNELSTLLKRETDPVLHVSPFKFISTTMRYALLRGNSIALIHRNGRKLDRLEFIEFWKVNINRNQTTGELLYQIQGKQGPVNGYFASSDVLHFKGLGDFPTYGVSVLTYAAKSLGSQLATQEIESSFYENGSLIKSWLQAPGKVGDDALKRLKDTWTSMYGGTKNAGKTPILEEGMEYKTATINAADLAFLESKAFGISDVARWFNCPPDKLFDWTKISYSSMEQSSANYALQTIAPWVRNMEQEINIKLCADDEYVKFNLDALIRADTVAKADAFVKLVQGGIYDRNEARELYDMNQKDGGTDLLFPLNAIPQSMVQKYYEAKIEQMLKGGQIAPDPNEANN